MGEQVLLIMSPGDPVEYIGFSRTYTYTEVSDNPDIIADYSYVVCAPLRHKGWAAEKQQNKQIQDAVPKGESGQSEHQCEQEQKDKSNGSDTRKVASQHDLVEHLRNLLWVHILSGGKVFFLLPWQQLWQVAEPPHKEDKQQQQGDGQQDKGDNGEDFELLEVMLAWSSMSSLVLAALAGPGCWDTRWRINPVTPSRWGEAVESVVPDLKRLFKEFMFSGQKIVDGHNASTAKKGAPKVVPFYFSSVRAKGMKEIRDSILPLIWFGEEELHLLTGWRRRKGKGFAVISVCPVGQVNAKLATDLLTMAEETCRANEIQVLTTQGTITFKVSGGKLVRIRKARGSSLYHTLLFLAMRVREGDREVPLKIIEEHLKKRRAAAPSGVKESVHSLWEKHLKRIWPHWPRGKPGLSITQGFVHIHPKVAFLLLKTPLPEDYGK